MPAVTATEPLPALAPLARRIADTVQDTVPDLPREQQALLVVQLLFALANQTATPERPMPTLTPAEKTAITLVDLGYTDSDALTTADIDTAADLSGVPRPDRDGQHEVRSVVDALTRSTD